MEVIVSNGAIEWKKAFGKERVSLPNANDISIVKAVFFDNYIYVGIRYKDNTSRVLCYNKKAILIDDRSYTWYFDDLYVDESVGIKYYNYNENSWVRGRLLKTAGVMAVQKEG